MTEQNFIDQLVRFAGPVPDKVEVLGLEQPMRDHVDQRITKLLQSFIAFGMLNREKVDPVRRDDSSLLHLPLGGRIVGYHASGAVQYTAGLPPMEKLIGPERARDELVRNVMAVASNLNLRSWTGRGEELVFERLWQIKACAADPGGRTVAPVVCRAVGAFRHTVGGIPVWGPASAVIQVAAESTIDAVRVLVRETTGQVVDVAQVLAPEVAARQVVRQLGGLIPEAGRAFFDIATPVAFRFGYVSLSKRMSQPLLAPVYVAEVKTDGEEPMGYLAVVPGSEKEYLPLARVGSAPPALERRRIP
jgi:hypothetical protein